MTDSIAGPIHFYGRDREIRLVQDFLDRVQGDDRVPRSRRVPVLVFSGPRGSGKSALLAELERQVDQQTPHAHVNFDAVRTESVRDVLAALAFELNRRCGEYGSLAFPRFITGQLAIAQRLDWTDRRLARDQVGAALEHYRKVDRLRDFLATTAPQVLGAVFPGAEQFPGVDGASRVFVELIVKELVSWRRGRRIVLGGGLNWYGHRDLGLRRDPLDTLVGLNRQAAKPQSGDNQGEVGELLWAAFLADLRHGFRHGRRADERALNCAVLLDNMDHPIGRRFVEGLVRARRQHAAYAPEDPDPLTVVATSRGALAAAVTARGGTVPTAAQASYEDSGKQPDRGWYPVLLHDLTPAHVGAMVNAAIPQMGINQRVTTAVHWFTAGHPGSTRLLLDAIAERPEERTDLHTVLEVLDPNALGAESATVEQRLLDQFRHGMSEDVLADLVTLAAAQDRDRALRLGAHSGLLTTVRGERELIFGPEYWTADGRMLPVLRRLLLRRLAARPAEHPASWSEVHGWVRDDHTTSGEQVGAHYHALALGEVEPVTRWFADLLPRRDVAEWLALLTAVTSAPNRLDRRVPPLHQARELTRWVDESQVPLARLAWLVVTRWIAEDSLAANHLYTLHLEIAAEFNEIAPYAPKGLATLRNEAARHRIEAEQYRTAAEQDRTAAELMP